MPPLEFPDPRMIFLSEPLAGPCGKPAYLKTQTISLTSIINGPLTISAKLTPDLNQEMATEVSYRWTKIK